MSIDTRTPAEIAYDATSLYLKPIEDDDALTPDEETVLNLVLADPWEAVLDITSDPTNDGRAPVCATCGDDGDCPDCDDSTEKERAPVPPVPAGYPTDKALIYKSYGETFISIDRRDGELLICDQGTGADNAVILSGARALALYRFFWNDAMIELMEYHRKNATHTAPLAG